MSSQFLPPCPPPCPPTLSHSAARIRGSLLGLISGKNCVGEATTIPLNARGSGWPLRASPAHPRRAGEIRGESVRSRAAMLVNALSQHRRASRGHVRERARMGERATGDKRGQLAGFVPVRRLSGYPALRLSRLYGPSVAACRRPSANDSGRQRRRSMGPATGRQRAAIRDALRPASGDRHPAGQASDAEPAYQGKAR